LDYTGSDTNGDGFGDIPYNIIGGSNKDYLPLFVPGTLEGHVTFMGRGSNNTQWIETFVVMGFEQGNLTNELWTKDVTTNNTGFFSINVTPGTYDVGIKNATCLSKLVTNVTLTAGNTTVVDFGTVREGDIDNNDWVASSDLSRFCAAYGTKPGDAGWNADADLNRDNWVSSGDLSLFCADYNLKGDAYGYF